MVTHHPAAEGIARAVAEALADAGISHKAAADAALIPRTTLRRKLAGASPFTIPEIARLATVLGLTPSDLMARAEGGTAA